MEDEIFITGMSGRFPDADNVAEFWEKLCNKVDCITDEGRRWPPGAYGNPKRMGLLNHLDKFDNLFFGIHHKLSNELDPQARILMEVVYESIIDAGYDPETFRGKNIGVFFGSYSVGSDSVMFPNEDIEKFDGYGLLGCSQSLVANRISYAFDFKGPSVMVDTACSSGATAFYHAYQALRKGECDAAIVSSSVIQLKPEQALAFKKLKLLSDDGKCKSFDASADGYVKSEAIVSLFVQRSNSTRRKYASVVNIKTNTDGFKPEGITYPSSEMQKRLMQSVLKECNVHPSEISYIEAHATGTRAGDPVEVKGITDVYCCGRQEPLLIGSVKSNIGHTEASSGLCGIVKILLAMETGFLPPNIHYNEPIPELKPFVDKELKVVTELTPWNGRYAALNSFGFGGVNVSLILKRPVLTPKAEDEMNKSLPRLLLSCGRTEESVRSVLKNSIFEDVHPEFLALFHKLAYSSPKKKPFRSYAVLGTQEIIQDINMAPYEKRPVWYVFSGMGTQWPGMAKDLMKIKIFRDSIKKSEEILKPYVPDLMDILNNEFRSDISLKHNENTDRKIIPAFVSIAAMQIALVDVLTELGLKPDGIVGHSVGELGCGYADGCLTHKQMLLASYWRGKSTEDSDLIQGSMAATGMTWSEAQERCPKDIYPACHNAEDSVTISGPADSMKRFINELKSGNEFVREVNTCGYAYHCRYVLPIADKLQLPMEKKIFDPCGTSGPATMPQEIILQQSWKSGLGWDSPLQVEIQRPLNVKYASKCSNSALIPEPIKRSSRWISSSYPENKWQTPDAKYASATYYVHNLVSPVLFCDAIRHVPQNAIVIEIGPHQLLQTILKREIGAEAVHIGLMKRNVDNVLHFLSSIGKMYTSGLNPDVDKLYTPVTFPVPRNTPMISPLMEWDHSETWTVFKWDEEIENSVMHYLIDPGSQASADRFLLGHCIDGRTLFPAAGYIVLVWKTLAKSKLAETMNMVPLAFKDVKFIKATLLSENAKTKLTVSITKISGYFEISEKGDAVCSGFVSSLDESDKKKISNDITIDRESLTLNEKDIYKELLLRGYEYGSTFQGIKASNVSGSEGILNWNKNWIVYLDVLFQFSLISMCKRQLLLPTKIEKLIINPLEFKKCVEEEMKYPEGVPVKYNTKTKECFTPGIYVKNMKASFQERRPVKQTPLLEEYRFVPYVETCALVEDEKNTLTDYNSLCLSMSKKILHLIGKENNTEALNINNTEIDKYLKSDADDCVLLKCFSRILSHINCHDEYSKVCLKKYLSEFENDILHNVVMSESILRTTFDIVAENTNSRALKVLEITEGCKTISSKIDDYISIPALLKISYSVLHPEGDLLNKNQLPASAEVKAWHCNSLFEFENVDLIILNYLKNSFENIVKTLRNAVTCLKKEGFILLVVKSRLTESERNLSKISEMPIPIIREDDLEPLFKDMNLTIICKKTDSFTSTLFLLRRCDTALYKDLVVYINTDEYSQWVDNLKNKIMQIQNYQNSSVSERLWLVSEDHHRSGVIGLAKCLRKEPGGNNVRCVFIRKKTPKIPNFSLTNPFYKVQIEKNLAINVLQNGAWGSYRHIRCLKDSSDAETEHAYLNIKTIGDLSTLEWINSSMKYATLGNCNTLCYVYYSSLNFKDVMIATGRVPVGAFSGGSVTKDGILGIEFSGRTADGRRVMGIVANKGMATSVIANSLLLWDVPKEWSLKEAATIPVVYTTAYYALVLRGRLKKGERILIHSGSGGVGQAAITIALSMGCDVYTTVGSKEKKEFLKKKFPKLQEEHISSSRDTSFEQDILNSTNGEGVHVVLNSLADEKLFASLSCLAFNGRFLEIGKYDLNKNSNLGMEVFLKNVTFHGVTLDSFFNNTDVDTETKTELQEMLKDGIVSGVVKPLDTTVFNYDEAQKAFRYMASGRHIGKVVLKIREEEKDRKAIPSPIRLTALQRTLFNPKKSYILLGGLGGIGLELSQWMIDRGAKIIVLSSRSGITTGYQAMCLERWKQESVQVVITKLNAAKPEEAKSIIMTAAKLGSVGGIFNLAVVSKDALMVNQSVQSFADVCEAKVESTKNMDLLSREFCPELNYFVCFSSIACGRGNDGQCNYGYANSVMERICEDRANEGLPGLAIQYGIVGDVGMAKETMGSDIALCGTVSQRIRSCLKVLGDFLQQRHPVVSSFVPYESRHEFKKIEHDDLMAYVSNIFGINDMSSINPEANLSELGMDSLMAVELRHVLEMNFDIILSFSDMQNLKVKDLKKIANKSSTKDNEKEDEIEATVMGNVFGNLNAFPIKDLIPSTTIVHMNTITDGVPLFIIHPGEGHVASLETLAKLLPCPVYGIQSTLESPRDSIENVATWYWKNIKEFNISTKVINLSGYSYGTMIAFQMALDAEQDPSQYPEIQNVILLEGSHNHVSSYLRLLASSIDEAMSDVALQIAGLLLFTWQFPRKVNLDKKELLKLDSFPDRLQYTKDKVSAAFPDITSDVIETTYQRVSSNVQMCFVYEPKNKLKKDVHLIKSTQILKMMSFLSELYDLDKVCDGNIITHTIEGTHQSILQGSSAEKVANVMKDIFSL